MRPLSLKGSPKAINSQSVFKDDVDIVPTIVDNSKEGGDWDSDNQKAINMICYDFAGSLLSYNSFKCCHLHQIFVVYVLVYARLVNLAHFLAPSERTPPKNSLGCNLLFIGALQPKLFMRKN